jgi:hypothetical protein
VTDPRDRDEILNRIRDQIQKGNLGNEWSNRMHDAEKNAAYYSGDFKLDQQLDNKTLDDRAWRSVPIMGRIVDTLCQVYEKPPTRTLQKMEAATECLAKIYKGNAVDAVLQAADAHTCVNEVSALEVYGNNGDGSDEKPVGIRLWTGECFTVWPDPDDATKPLAVATIDKYDEQRRIRLWTLEGRETFVSYKLGLHQTSGGRGMYPTKKDPNPYRDPQGRPVLPFAFCHWKLPVTGRFWCGSPGDGLREFSRHLNYRLTKNADDILHNRPIGTISGAEPGWNFPRDRKAGEFVTIPQQIVELTAAGGQNAEATYVVCDLGFLDTDWKDLQDQLNMILQANGVPPAAVRMEQVSAQSGVAIVAEQIPVLRFQQARRQPFTLYEQQLARLVFAVARSHAENNEVEGFFECSVQEMSDAYYEASDLSMRWPRSLDSMLQEQQTATNQFLLDNYLASRTQLAMQIFDMDRKEAEKYIAEVAKDVEREKKLFGEDKPEDAMMPGMEPSPMEGAAGVAEPEDEEDEKPEDVGSDADPADAEDAED